MSIKAIFRVVLFEFWPKCAILGFFGGVLSNKVIFRVEFSSIKTKKCNSGLLWSNFVRKNEIQGCFVWVLIEKGLLCWNSVQNSEKQGCFSWILSENWYSGLFCSSSDQKITVITVYLWFSPLCLLCFLHISSHLSHVSNPTFNTSNFPGILQDNT